LVAPVSAPRVANDIVRGYCVLVVADNLNRMVNVSTAAGRGDDTTVVARKRVAVCVNGGRHGSGVECIRDGICVVSSLGTSASRIYLAERLVVFARTIVGGVGVVRVELLSVET